jgi:ABC-type dipeptide/oligopeptide/nickel transport system permease component
VPVVAGRSMLAFALKRLALAVLVSIAVSTLAFLLLRASGDVAVALAGESARSEDIENIRRIYGLDRPLVVQYADWLLKMTHGDFGQSLYFKTDVLDLVRDKLPTTALLAVFSLLFALVTSIPLGIFAAVYPNTWIDRLCLAVAVIGQALPNFFFALVLIMVFAVMLQTLPVSGSESWANFVLPSIALGYYVAPAFMRLTRAGMIDVLGSDYIRTARAKGLSGASIVLKHALRNALVPVVALAAVQLGYLLGGSVVIETIFALDGLGYLAYRSISHLDLPVTQAIVTLLSFIYVGLTLAADIVNAWIDPRIRVG